jgi:DNA-binding transcriptional LysR family regulator
MTSFRRIQSFVAVYEEGSFTSAAEREGATQSGVSQHVKQLENELGVELFERVGRDVIPTRAGKLYYAQCAEALKKLDLARQSVGSSGIGGAIRVGLMPTFTRSILPPALKMFLDAAPGAEISVIEAYSGVLTDMTLKGELDFAVVPAFEGRAGISHHLIARDREVIVRARRGSRPNDLKSVRLSEYGPLKIVLPAAQNTRRRNIETYLSTNEVQVAERLEMDAMMGTLQFVAASDWVAILPFVMMASDLDDRRFEIRPLDEPPFYSEFVLIEPSRQAMSPAAALFAGILKKQTERALSVFGRDHKARGHFKARRA